MFSNSFNNDDDNENNNSGRSRRSTKIVSPVSPSRVQQMMGPNGIPKPKSLLASFLFSALSGPEEQRHEQVGHQASPRSLPAPRSLQSNLLPPCLLGEKVAGSSPRSRTVTDDATEEPAEASSRPLLPLPRRSWKISRDDSTALSRVPSFYPPLDPNCTALVTDAPPSIVVVRISECLRKRSIAAEYDDESVVARCMTVDRCEFEIQLYRSSSSPATSFLGGDDFDVTMADLGTLPSTTYNAPRCDAVIVEVRRLSSGSSITSFHAACRKILMAAKGLDAGTDERKPRCRNGMEFRYRPTRKRGRDRLAPACGPKRPRSLLAGNGSPSSESGGSAVPDETPGGVSSAESALEGALELLRKDRLECRRLGMERLVDLTNPDSCGRETCRHVGTRLLSQEQSPHHPRGVLMEYLMHPGAAQLASETVFGSSANAQGDCDASANENENSERMVRSFLESSALSASPLASHSPQKQQRQQSAHHWQSPSSCFKKKMSLALHRRPASPSPGQEHNSDARLLLSPDDLRHEARLRAMALRVLCNILDHLSATKELRRVLYPKASSSEPRAANRGVGASRWVQPAFLLSLVQELQGAGRPPSVAENGYKLASVHEAALAARCLRLLAGYEGEDDDEDEKDCDERHPPPRTGDDDDEDDDCHRNRFVEEVRDFLRSEPVLERLSYARLCGRVTHAILEFEAHCTYRRLTEDARSC